MSVEIWIPESAAPEFTCLICGKPMWKRREYETHVPACATEHQAELNALRPSVRSPVFMGGPWDKELGAWVDENREAIIEGRKRFGTGADS